MSGGGFRGRGFGPHGARYSSPQQSGSRHDDQRNTPRGRGNYQRNNFNSSSRQDDNWQRSSQQQRYTRWDQGSHPQPWANSHGRSDHFQNSVRYPYQQHNSSYQQRNNRPYGRGRGGSNDGYGYSGSRGPSNFYSPYYNAPFRERNYEQQFEKEPEEPAEPAVPLLGSEEERQQKITEAADELKRKLLSNRLNSPIEPNWYDDFNLDTPNKDEDEENVVKAKPELKHGPPELDLTVSELKDIGRVDFDNTVNLSNASDNNYDEAPVEIVDDLGSWNNLSADPHADVDDQPAIEDDCIGASETIDELSGTIVDSFDDFHLDNFEIATLKVRDPLTYDESTTTALSDTAYTTDAAVLETTSVTDTLTRNDSLNNFGDNDVTSDKNETTPDKSEVTSELHDSMHYTVQISSTQLQSPEHHEFSTDNTSRKLSETIESKSSSQSKSKTKKKRKPMDVIQAPPSSPLQSPKQTDDLSHKEDKVDEPSLSTNFAINDVKNDSNKQTNSPIKNKPGGRQPNKQPAQRSGTYQTTGAEEFHLPAAFDPRRSSNLSLSTMVPEFDPQLPPPMLTHNAHMPSMPMMNPAMNMQAPMASFPPPHSSYTPMVPYAAPIPLSYPPVIPPVEYSSVSLSQVSLPLSLAEETIDNQASNKPDVNGDSNVSVDDLLGDMQKAMEFAEQCLHSNSNDAIEFPTLPNLPELPPLPETEAPTTKKKKKKKNRNKFEPPKDYGPLQNPNLDGNNLIVANEETVTTTEIPMEVFTATTKPIKAITTPITTAAAITSDTTPVTTSLESMMTSKTSITSKASVTSKSSTTTTKASITTSITTTKAPETTAKTSITAPKTTKIPGTTTNTATTTTTTKTSLMSSTKSSDNKITDEDATDDLKRRKVMFNLNSKFKKISNKTDDWFGNEPPEEDSKTKLKRLKILLQQESDADIMATTLTTPTVAVNDSSGGSFKSKQSYHESDKVNNESEKSITESNERDHKKSKDKTRSKPERRESRKASDKSEISLDKNNKHVLRKISNDNNYKTSCTASSSAGQPSTSKPEKVNDHSHNDHHNTQTESSDSKTPHASLSTWKNRVITRFLRMSKNDIQNMINNSSLRKFDIAMQSLVKEKKSSLSLEMRLNEDEKMKNSTHENYENEDFMSQLQAILDPAATIDITNLPTTFIHQLSEVLHLDPLPPDNDELNCDKASLRLALNLDNPSTSNSEIDYNAAGVSSGSTSVSESSRFAGTNTPANVAHITTTHDVTAKQRKIDNRVSKDTTKNSVNPTNPTLYTIRTRTKRTDVDPTPSGQQHCSNTSSPSQPVSTSSSTSTSKLAPISKSVSTSTSKPASKSAVPPVTATASIPAAPSAISTIITTAPISTSKVTTHHAENFNMNDLDDIFSAGIARAKTVKSQAAVAAQASNVKPVPQSSTERLMPIVENKPILRRIETPIVERVERQAVELDKIFTAGIAKAKAASLKNAASFANMVDDLHDMREYRTQRDSSRESSSNSGGVWKRKVIIDDPDNFRNLTKEEYEARHGEPPYASYYEDEYKDFAAVRARRLAMNGRESIPPSYGVDNSYFNFSPQFGNSQHISNPDESEDEEHSLAGSESSSWSSSSSGNEDNVELDVSKVLRFIKEREKIAKIKSINDEIRDEVNAEIEKKRREKNARHKSHKSRSKKRDKRKKDKKGKRKKLKKKKRRRGYHSSPVTDNPEERPLWLLREDEIKKEPKEDEIFAKELEPPRADNCPKQAIIAAITKTAPPMNVNKNIRAPVSVSAGTNVQSSSASTPASMTAVSKNIHTQSMSTAVTTRISTSIATSTAKSVSTPTPLPSLTTQKSISTDSPVTSSSTNLSSGVTKPTTSGLIKATLTTTSTATSPLRVVTTSCTSSNTSSAQSPVTFTKTKAQLKQMPEIVQQNNKSTSSLASIEQPVVHSTSDNAGTSSINSTNVQTPSPTSSTSSVSSICNTTMTMTTTTTTTTTTITTTTTTTSNLKTRKLDIKAYKERALQRKIKEQETMRRVAENPSQLTQNLLNLPTKKKKPVAIENSSQVIPQVKPTVTSEVNVTQPTKVSSSTDILIKESINPETDPKNAKTLMPQSKKQPVTPEKPAADASKPVISTTPRKLKRKTPLITDNPSYAEPVVSGEVNKFVNIKSEGGKELKLREKVKNRPSKPAAADAQEVVPKKITPAARKKRKSSTNLATVIPETTADESIKNNLSETPRKTSQSAGPEAIKPIDSDAIESAKSDNSESIEKKNALQPTKVSVDTKTTNKRKKSLINIETDVSSEKQKVEAERKQEKSGEGKINSLNVSAVDSCELKINKSPMASFSHYFKPSKNLMKDDLPNLVAVERMEIKDKLPVISETQLLITNSDDNNSTVKTDVTYVSEVPSISKSINIESQQPVKSTVNLLPLSDKRIEIELSGVKETPNKEKILREKELALDDDKEEEATCSVTSAEVPPMNDQISDIDSKVISPPVEEINQTKEVFTKTDKLGDASQGTVKINTDPDRVEDLFSDNLLSNHEPEEDIVNFVTSELSNDLSKTEKIEATSSVSPVCSSTLTLIGVGSSSLSTENLTTILLHPQESPVKSLNSADTECILGSNAAVVDPMRNIGDITAATLSEISEDSLNFEKSYSQGSLPDVDPLSECANKYDKIDVLSSKEPDDLCIANLSGDVSLADLKEDLPLDAPSSPATDNCFKEYSSQSVVLHDQVLTADNPRSSFLEDPLVFSTTKDFPTSDGLEFEVLEDTGVMVEPIYENQLADTSSIDAIEDVPSDQPFVEDEEVVGALALTALDNPCLSSVLETDFVTDQNTAQISIEGSVSPSIADKELIKVIEGTSPERLPSPILQGQSFVEDESDTPAIEEAPVPEVCDEGNKINETAKDQPTLDDNLTEIDSETFRSLNNLKNSITTDATVADDFSAVKENLASELDDDAAASKEDTATVAEATAETTESIKLVETPAAEQVDLKKSLPETSTLSSLPKELPVTKSDKDEDKHSSQKSNSSKSSTPPREHKKHRKHHHERKKSKITIEKVEEAITENIVKLVPKPTTKDEVMTRMQEIDITIQELMNEKMRLYQMLQTDKWPITQPAASSKPGPKSSKLRAPAISKSARVIVSRLTDNKIKQVSPETSPLKQDTSPSKSETTSTISSLATTSKTLKMDDKKSKTADESSVVKSGKKRKHREDKDHAKSKEPRLEGTAETNKKRHHSDASHRKQKKTEPANVVASAANKQREESPRKHVKLSQILKGDMKPKASKRRSPSPVEAHPTEQPASSRKSRSVSAEKNVQKDLKAKVDREKSPIDDNVKNTPAEEIISSHTEKTPLKSHIITGLKDQSLIYSDDSTWDTFDSAMKHERPTGLMLLEESMKREKAARKNKYIEQKKKQLNKKTLDAPALSEDEEELPLAELMSKKRLQRKKLQQAVKKNVSKASESLKNENIADTNKSVSKVEETSSKISKDDVSSKTSSISGVETSTKSSDNYVSNEEVFSKDSSSSTAQISTTQSKSFNSNEPPKDHLLEIIDAVAENRVGDLSDSLKKSKKELKQKDSEMEDNVIVADERETVTITLKNDKIEQAEPQSRCNVNPGPAVDSPKPLPENDEDCDAEESIPEEAEWTTLDSIGFVDDDSQHTASDVRSVVSEQDKNNKGDGDSLDTAKEHGTKEATVNDDKENQQKKLLQDWDELSIISDKDFDNDNCDINKKNDESEEIIDKKTGESMTTKISGEDQSMTTEDLVQQKESNKDSTANKIDNDSLPTRFDDTVERPKSTVQELLRSKTPLPTVSQESSLVDDEKDESNVEGEVESDKNALMPDEKEEDKVQTMNKKYKTVEIRLQRSKPIVKESPKSKTTVKSVQRNPLSSSDEDEIEKEIISSKKHKRVEIEERPKSTVKELERSKSTVKELERPKSTVKELERPKSTVKELERRKSTVKELERPKSTVKELERPKSTVKELERRKSTVKELERPKSTVKELERPKSTVKELERPKSTVKELRSKTPIPRRSLISDNEDDEDEEDDVEREIISDKSKTVEINERPKSTVKELGKPKSIVKDSLRSRSPMPNNNQKSVLHNEDDDNDDANEDEIVMSKKHKRVEIEERPKSTVKKLERPKSTVPELLRSKTPVPSLHQKSLSDNDEDFNNDDKEEDYDDDEDDIDREITASRIQKVVEVEVERPKSTVKELLRSKTPMASINFEEDNEDLEDEIVLNKIHKRVSIEIERPRSTVKELERPKSTVKELLRSKTPIPSMDQKTMSYDSDEDDVEREIENIGEKQKRVEIEERPKSTVKELERPKSTVKELLRSKTPIKSLDIQKSAVDDEDEEEEEEIVQASAKKQKKVEIDERPKSTVRELERPKSTVKELQRSKTPVKSLDALKSVVDNEDEEEENEIVQTSTKKRKKNLERPKSTVKELERPKFTLKDLFRSKTPMPSFDDQNSSFEDDEEENIFEPVTRKRRKKDKNAERPKSTVRELERPKSTVKELLRPKTPAKGIDDEKSSTPGAENEDEPVTKRRGRFAKNRKMASNRRGSRQSDDSNKTTSRSRRVGKSPSSRDVSPPPEIDTAATTIATTALNKKRPTSGGSSSSVSSRKRGAAASPKIQQQLDNSRSNRRGRKRRNNKLNYDPAEMMKCKVTLVDCKRICLRPESHSDFLQQYGVTKINIRKLSTSSSSSASSSREEVDQVVEELPETVRSNDDSKAAETYNLNKSVLMDEEKNLTDDEKMSDDDKTHSDDDSMEFIRVEETEDTLGSCSNIQDSRGSRLSSMNDFVSSPHENDELPASDFEVINDDDDDHEASDIEVLEKEIPVPSNTIQPSPSSSSSVPEEKESSSEPRRTQYTVHKGPILDIKVFGDSFLAASEDGAIYRYSQRSNGILNIYKGHEAAVTCLYVHEVPVPGSTNKRWNLFSGSLDATLRCYDIMSGTLNRNVAQVGSPVQCMDEAWGSIFIGTKSGHISRYDIKSGCLREEKLDFSDKPVLALRASTEGVRKVLIVASRNQPITIRDAQNGLFLRTISGQRNHTVYSLLRDRNLVYCGTSNTSIPVFDFISGEQVMQFTAGVGIVCMRLYKQLLFAGCYDGNIYVFDTKEPKLLCSIPGPGNMLLSMEIVDDEIIAGSKDRRLHAWQMPDQIRVIVSERT
ncbi:serine-rich adhesin for platelets-like isoform X2 [Cotesia glomerata]|uniref:serine-rich adhesin for platelets-like isoform X2 n=1 Tax=Cotesia glomerata TaxID=32391 RepID=UPI001D017C77|nr:serine-rich adhesin for platelets-like isoform X2 [Cotesia glomerata]